MSKVNKAKLVEGKVSEMIIKLTLPMIAGMLGLVIFNLVDTFYIAKLGIKETAALTFTFPVVLMVNNIALGLGLGTASVVSRAVGKGDEYSVRKLSTDSLILSVLVVFIFMIIGLNTINPLFKMLGASQDVMVYIEQYMKIWYFGSIFVVVPMVGNNIIRSLGDTKTPAMIMLLSATINIIVDPLLIFGLGPFPKLGISGAAIATVFARAVTFIFALYILIKRDKIITFKSMKLANLIASWKQVLYIGVPAAITRMILPFATGVITNIISVFGISVIAGFGIATKIEFFLLISVKAMSSIMISFVGQNYGALRYDRVKVGIIFCEKVSMILSLIIYIFMVIFANSIANLFTNNIEVINIIKSYLLIVPIGYGLQGIFLVAVSTLNAINKPIKASLLTIFQVFIIYIPLAKILNYFLGINGIFIALASSYIIGGFVAHFIVKGNFDINYYSN
jgi:putative MATE family efflux protein